MAENALAVIAQQFGVALLPDEGGYRHRMHVKSETSSRLYVVSQRVSDGEWCCGCRGWISHRRCKHLQAMLPALRRLGAPAAAKAAPTPSRAANPQPQPSSPRVAETLPAMEAIRQIPRQRQTQASLNSQLRSLREAAQRLGLYDAADFLRDTLERR